MNCAIAVALLGIALLPVNASPAQVKTKKPSQTKSSTATASKSGTARRKVAGRSSRRAASRPSYQLHPDPERYQQIQQALADRGYFKGKVNGQWGDDSVEALKRFQAAHKVEDDGKINALTLTGLGLGPQHVGASATAGPPATGPAPQSAPEPRLLLRNKRPLLTPIYLKRRHFSQYHRSDPLR